MTIRARQFLVIAVITAGIGCGKTKPESAPTEPTKVNAPPVVAGEPDKPWIKAEPNPVPITGSGPGSTNISWDTIDNTDSQVYLRVEGKPDQLFSGGPKNSSMVNWIHKDGNYLFILFAGKDHQKELARVVVTTTK